MPVHFDRNREGESRKKMDVILRLTCLLRIPSSRNKMLRNIKQFTPIELERSIITSRDQERREGYDKKISVTLDWLESVWWKKIWVAWLQQKAVPKGRRKNEILAQLETTKLIYRIHFKLNWLWVKRSSLKLNIYFLGIKAEKYNI